MNTYIHTYTHIRMGSLASPPIFVNVVLNVTRKPVLNITKFVLNVTKMPAWVDNNVTFKNHALLKASFRLIKR